MICFPNAKINLGLNVTGKRPDGYHNLETLFYPIPLRDALEVVPAGSFSFSQTGIALEGTAEENLVMKALERMKARFDIQPLEVHLHKAIPFGAGLGGGSADAAFMLKLVNDVGRLGLSDGELEEMAATIGADCPFFIRNQPVFASGTGNVFTPADLSLKGYTICLVKPDIAVSTPEAYSLLTPAFPETPAKEVIRKPVREWKGLLVNDFEKSVFARYPEIRRIKEALYDAGAVYAAMSGSGSAVFGLFERAVSLKKDFSGCFVWEGELT